MWTFILLCISIVGLIVLFIFKRWEEGQDLVAKSAFRTTLDTKVLVISTWLKVLPLRVKELTKLLIKQIVFYVSAIMLRVVQFTERKLIRVINLVKGRGDDNTKKGSASFFLQNVATYKDNQPTE